MSIDDDRGTSPGERWAQRPETTTDAPAKPAPAPAARGPVLPTAPKPAAVASSSTRSGPVLWPPRQPLTKSSRRPILWPPRTKQA